VLFELPIRFPEIESAFARLESQMATSIEKVEELLNHLTAADERTRADFAALAAKLEEALAAAEASKADPELIAKLDEAIAAADKIDPDKANPPAEGGGEPAPAP
jgi:sensor domain CHASE-containing protein